MGKDDQGNNKGIPEEYPIYSCIIVPEWEFQRENRIGTKINPETVLPVEFRNENKKWVNREFPRNSLVVKECIYCGNPHLNK
jgi:hypothetical protein